MSKEVPMIERTCLTTSKAYYFTHSQVIEALMHTFSHEVDGRAEEACFTWEDGQGWCLEFTHYERTAK
jgi:hypothetical protein